MVAVNPAPAIGELNPLFVVYSTKTVTMCHWCRKLEAIFDRNDYVCFLCSIAQPLFSLSMS